MGVVPIVRNIGWYSELSDDIAVKVESAEQLIEELRKLKDNPEKLQQMSRDGIQAMEQDFNYAMYARHIFDFVQIATSDNDEVAQRLKAGNSPSLSS